MTYIQGFLVPVPEANKDAYREMAASAVPLFKKHGIVRMVECWSDDVPRGETTDMYGAVKAESGEAVVFSWVDWGSKEICDKASAAMMQDPEMQMSGDMPFDGMRMVFAGFDTSRESGKPGGGKYVQGFVAPVPKAKREAHAEMAKSMHEFYLDCGALYAFDGWGEDIADGKLTDFKRGVKLQNDEAVVFGFVEWPTKQACEACMAKAREDARMPDPATMPFDGKRMIYGTFVPILDA